MTTLGQAYVQIMPSAKGISGSIQKTINPEATAAGKSAGRNIASSMASSMSSAGKTLTKAITVPAMAAATAVGGIVAAFGWKRLVAVDAAQAQLKGLGYSAEDVSRISDGLRDAITGGMLTMAEATSAAATAMAAGVQEGDELTRYIQLLDSAVVGGTGTFAEMEQIFGRVVDQGKLTRTEFDMIAQRMPGFSAAVQDHMGVGSEAMYEMLRNGEITTDDFLDVMENFAGGMADAYADSWSGMVQNTLANVGIIGETILGGVFEQSKESIAEFLDFLRSDDLKAWAAETGQVIGDAFNRVIEVIRGAIEWWTSLDGSTQKLIMTIAGIAVAIGPVLMIAGKLITTVMNIHSWFGQLRFIIAPLVTAIGSISTPVLIVIGVIAALIGVFTALYQSNEGFRDLVQNVWATIQETISTVVQAISDFVMGIVGTLVAWWQENNELIRESAQIVWEVIQQMIMSVIDAIVPHIMTAWEIIKTVTSTVWNVIKTVIETILNVVMGIVKAVMQAITGDWSGAWQTIQGVVSTIINGIRNIISSVMSGIFSIIGSILSNIQSRFSSILNVVRNVVSGAFNSIRSIISSVLSAAWGIISNILGNIRSRFSSIFNGLRSIVSSAFNSVRSAVSNGMTRAFNAVKNFFGRFRDAGKRIVTSIADGIKGAISTVTDAITGVVDSVRDFLPFSPAKEGPLKDLDKLDFGGTISVGIEDGEEEVQKAMDELLSVDPSKKARFHYPINTQENASSATQQNQPIILQVDGKTFAQIIGDYTSQEGGNRIRRIERGLST